MADSGYDAEVSGIQAFLSMQHDKGDVTPLSPGQVCSDISLVLIEVSHLQGFCFLLSFVFSCHHTCCKLPTNVVDFGRSQFEIRQRHNQSMGIDQTIPRCTDRTQTSLQASYNGLVEPGHTTLDSDLPSYSQSSY